jgi:hypothetical protein
MKLLTALLALIVIAVSPASASPRYTAAKQSAERVKKDEKELARRFARLTATERAKLKAAFRALDSDGDGVSDILEGAIKSSRCDADSDDDGVDDGDDSDEDNADSDGDGHNDGSEVEAKGKVISFTDPILVVGGKSFTVTATTTFRGTGFDKSDLVAGLCIEVEGHTDGASTIADKIKQDDDC